MGATARKKALSDGKKYYRNGVLCKNGHDGLRRTDNGRCVQCERVYRAEYVGRPNVLQRKRAQAKIRDYQIDEAKLAEMMAVQGSRCAVCQCEFGFERHNAPNIDHDHETGAIRGLLCGPCNLGIGNARESQNILRAMIAYLAKFQGA